MGQAAATTIAGHFTADAMADATLAVYGQLVVRCNRRAILVRSRGTIS